MSEHPLQSQPFRTRLIADMTDGPYASCDRLPPENVLAERMGISRTQLRDILASLEREGFITRRHGVGTIINRHVLNVPTRMDIEEEFTDMIRSSGYEPGIAFVHVSDSTADAPLAARLRLEEDAPLIRISRLCTADGKPAIYCEDVIPRSLIRRDYSMQDCRDSVFRFLQDVCGVTPYMDLTDVHAVTADAMLGEILQVAPGTPLLQMDEVDYDIDGNPVVFSRQYFVDGIFSLTVLRKKL